MGCNAHSGYSGRMTEPSIRDFHAHIYYDPEQVELAKQLAAAAQQRFPIAVGHFHLRPVGPHPRGSVQLTVPRDAFGDVAQFLALNRGGLTIFAHAETGEDLADHTEHVIWFGPSEELNLSIFS
jgi:aromatic ring-cleaving dioxygenase